MLFAKWVSVGLVEFCHTLIFLGQILHLNHSTNSSEMKMHRIDDPERRVTNSARRAFVIGTGTAALSAAALILLRGQNAFALAIGAVQPTEDCTILNGARHLEQQIIKVYQSLVESRRSRIQTLGHPRKMDETAKAKEAAVNLPFDGKNEAINSHCVLNLLALLESEHIKHAAAFEGAIKELGGTLEPTRSSAYYLSLSQSSPLESNGQVLNVAAGLEIKASDAHFAAIANLTDPESAKIARRIAAEEAFYHRYVSLSI